MLSSVVQRVLLKMCEEGREVSVGLSDFIISDRTHKWNRAGRGRRWPLGRWGEAEVSELLSLDGRCSHLLGSLI